MTQDDIATGSKIRKSPNFPNQYFTFNDITGREVYEILLKLDSNKGPGT